MDALEAMTDEAMYQIYQVNRPALVAAITDLLRLGKTPAEIEARIVAKYGVIQTARDVGHIAEYLARQPR
jgi:hypothetical protein